MQSKVEPPSLDPAEEPLLWEGLTLNKCILVASVVALLSVTFQVLQGESGARTEREGAARPCCHLLAPVPCSLPAPCSKEGIARGRQEPPPPPIPGGSNAPSLPGPPGPA